MTADDSGPRSVVRGIELTPDRPVAEVATLAEHAESAGFETVFCSSHYNNRDPFVALSRVAAATETVQLGPGVVNPYETHPVALASGVATLDEVSGGRTVFGIGAGDRSTLANLGIERERPLRRVLETVRVARQLWAGKRVDHDGTFRAQEAGLNFEPPGEIPIYVGAQGPDMLRMAAKHADGTLINAAHPRDLAWASKRIAEGLDERPTERLDDHPDERGAFEALAFASVSVGDDPDLARETARRPVSFIVAGAPQPVLDRHDLDPELAGRIGEAIGSGEFSQADDLVTDAMLDAFAVAGGVETVAKRLDSLRSHVDGIVVAAPLGPDVARAVELAGEAFERALA